MIRVHVPAADGGRSDGFAVCCLRNSGDVFVLLDMSTPGVKLYSLPD